MASEYLLIAFTQKKIDRNINAMILLKFFSIVLMPMPIISVFVSRLWEVEPMQKDILWGVTLAVIVLMFCISVFLIKKNKKLKWELYYLEKESLERKKRVAKIRNENLSDYVQTKEIKEPTDNTPLPIAYYCVLLIIDIMIKVLIVDAI